MNNRSDAQAYELRGIVVNNVLEAVRMSAFRSHPLCTESEMSKNWIPLLIHPNADRLFVIDQERAISGPPVRPVPRPEVVTPPLQNSLRTMLPNSIPSAGALNIDASCKGYWRPRRGSITPAATCTFCLRMASYDVSCGHAPLRDFPRIEPHAHGIVAGPINCA